MIGTPEYMPAEQFKGKPRPSSDLYAMGMIAIQALTGLLPSMLEEDEDGEAVWRSQAPISDWLADFLAKMVRRDFKARYQTAAEASQALQNLMRRAATVATPRAVPQNVAPPLKPPLANVSTVVTPRPANPQTPKRVSALPSTVYQPPPSPVISASPVAPSRRTFLRRSLYVGLGSIGAISAYFFTFAFPSRSKRFTFETVSVNAQGKITERKTREAEFFTEDLGNDVVLDMVAIPGGSFTMGSPQSEAERSEAEGPQRTVTIQPFYMGKYVVTQAQWQAVAKLPQVKQGLEANPSRFKGANLPVDLVSWDEAVEFCARLSQLKGKTYRLPSEAEWEYACRAGTDTPFYFGETLAENVANYDATYIYANGSKGKYRKKTTDVGVFPPNGFGLYDMHGNVWEWCEDLWHKSYQGGPTDGSAWLSGNDNETRLSLMRGGSCFHDPGWCRSAFRTYDALYYRNYSIGFRVVCDSPRTL